MLGCPLDGSDSPGGGTDDTSGGELSSDAVLTSFSFAAGDNYWDIDGSINDG